MLGPESAHSPNAEDLNALYWAMLAIATALVVAINAALVALAIRHRAARGRRPRRVRSRGRAQFVAAAGLAALAALIFIAGVVLTNSASTVKSSGADGLQASATLTAQRTLDIPTGDPQPLRITAVGQQWIWRYEYPGSATESGSSSSPNPAAPAGTGASATFPLTFSYYELVVPVHTTVVLTLDSTDLLHRWWVPGLGAKADAIPGTLNQTWFRADEEGVFDGASYAFSGTGYPAMRTRVRVVGVPEYEQWLQQQAQGIQKGQAFVQSQLAQGGPLDQSSQGREATGGSQ